MLMKRSRFPTLFNDRSTSTQTRFSDLLDEFMEDAFSRGSTSFIPELNVYETEQEFEITLALPGMSKDDIEINMKGNRIVISGEREFEKDSERKYHRLESSFGSFERSLPLPDTIDEDNIDATYENGVLSITIPKVKEATGKKIEVS